MLYELLLRLVVSRCDYINEQRHEKTNILQMQKQRCTIPVVKTKVHISFPPTAKLICAFVFAKRIVQFLYFLNPEFPASSHLPCLYSLVCVGPVLKSHCWFSHDVAQMYMFVLTTNQMRVVPVAEWLRVLFLNHLIISPLCLVWIRAPLWPHLR